MNGNATHTHSSSACSLASVRNTHSHNFLEARRERGWKNGTRRSKREEQGEVRERSKAK